MNKELDLWQFVAGRLKRDECVMLLVVAESSGSSPGRQGYKMVVGLDGELNGSIGGGVMEMNLVDQSRPVLRDAETRRLGDELTSIVRHQVHREGSPDASGMICSGKQTVIFKLLTPADLATVESVLAALRVRRRDVLMITPSEFRIEPREGTTRNAAQESLPSIVFQPLPEGRPEKTPKFNIQDPGSSEFIYTEELGFKNDLYIIGGGHCALALSELMAKLDFHISLFDDRPKLNTLAKNQHAHDIKIVDSYDLIGDHIASGRSAYVVVMTLGYKTDEIVIRGLIDKEFKYFGVLGSKAKMATMLRSLREDGIAESVLNRIKTPIGLPINSRTPEEIAVSIAAEIISVKNAEP